jgi:hypothetical protein
MNARGKHVTNEDNGDLLEDTAPVFEMEEDPPTKVRVPCWAGEIEDGFLPNAS